MKITSNIPELIERLTKLRDKAASIDVSAALTIGVNAAVAQMKNRIFNQGLDRQLRTLGPYTGKKTKVTDRRYTFKSGLGSLVDAEDIKQGKKKLKRLKKNINDSDFSGGNSYFSEYEKERLAAGRQIRYKDLEFNGTLRRDIVVAELNNRAVCTFNSQEMAKIAEYQEIQIGNIRNSGRAEIFGLSDDERQLMKEQTNNALTELYAGLFNTI